MIGTNYLVLKYNLCLKLWISIEYISCEPKQQCNSVNLCEDTMVNTLAISSIILWQYIQH